MAHLWHRPLMSGILNAMVAVSSGVHITVGIGNVSTTFGYLQPSAIGSVSPSSFKGATILALESRTDAFDFAVILNGVLAQSFFSYVLVETTAGTIVKYRQQDAILAQGSSTSWTWGNGAASAFTATSPATRTVFIFP